MSVTGSWSVPVETVVGFALPVKMEIDLWCVRLSAVRIPRSPAYCVFRIAHSLW